MGLIVVIGDGEGDWSLLGRYEDGCGVYEVVVGIEDGAAGPGGETARLDGSSHLHIYNYFKRPPYPNMPYPQ